MIKCRLELAVPSRKEAQRVPLLYQEPAEVEKEDVATAIPFMTRWIEWIGYEADNRDVSSRIGSHNFSLSRALLTAELSGMSHVQEHNRLRELLAVYW